MLIHRTAMILRIAATLSFFASLGLLAKPASVAIFLGFDEASISTEFLWVLRALALVLVAISFMAPLIASFAGERGLRQCASAMAVTSLLAIVLIVISPTEWVIGKFALLALILGFAMAYLFALRGRRRNR